MRLPLEMRIGLRYTRARRRNHFISFITMISVFGIGLGVAALITVLSVMNGFERELRANILGMASHATVQGYDSVVLDWKSLETRLQSLPGIVGVAPFVQGEAMLRAGRELTGALIRGIDPELESRVSFIGDRMVEGSLSDLVAGKYQVLIGAELSMALGVTVGERFDVMVPEAGVTPAGLLPRFRRVTVAGIFNVGLYEYDRSLVITHIDDAARLYRVAPGVSGVRLKLDDVFAAPRVSRQLMSELPPDLYATDWTRQHANFFRAVATEKTVMFVILSLIIAVAAFNIVSTLVMAVTDKQSDIAILRTLGLSPLGVMSIFVVQGTLIGLAGIAIGVAGGVALALNIDVVVPFIETLSGQDLFPADVYVLGELPSELNAPDVLRIAILAFVLSVVSTLYPAWRASRVQPAEALRYE